MKSVISAAMALLCLWPATSRACVDPLSAWSVGVVFSAKEQFNLTALENAAADSSAVLGNCIYREAYRGAAILPSGSATMATDPLTIEGITVSVNSLNIDIVYGGGCKEHRIDLYTDKKITASTPGQLDLWLSHNANGDMCKSLVQETVQFDLSSLGLDQSLKLRVFAPGATEPDSRMPVWVPASGAKVKLCEYKIRSVFSPTTMAAIGNFDGPFQKASIFNRVVLVFDTAAEPPTDLQKATAMEMELARLQEIDVATLTAPIIAKIKEALSKSGTQYWTLQDTVLPFNMWFDGSSTYGARGVYGTNGAKGCGSGVSYDIPVKAFTPTAIRTVGMPGKNHGAGFSAAVSVSGIVFTLPKGAAAGSLIVLSDLTGRRIAALTVVSDNAVMTLPLSGADGKRLSAGCYCATLRNGANIAASAIVTIQ